MSDSMPFEPMSEDLFDHLTGARADEMLTLMYGDGEWFRYPKKLTSVMSDSQALLMAFLINFSSSKEVRAYMKLTGGWFYCTVDRIRLEFAWSTDKQGEMVKALAAKGFIRTKRKGVPPKRHIQIDAMYLLKQVAVGWNAWMRDFYSQTTGKSNHRETPGFESRENPVIYKENELRDLTLSPRDIAPPAGSRIDGGESVRSCSKKCKTNKPTPPQKPFKFALPDKTEYQTMSAKLMDALTAKGIKYHHTAKKRWPILFAKEMRAIGASEIKRLRKVFLWYCDNVNRDQWFPKAYCPETFFKKYPRIEVQYSEIHGPEPSNKPSVVHVFVKDDGRDIE